MGHRPALGLGVHPGFIQDSDRTGAAGAVGRPRSAQSGFQFGVRIGIRPPRPNSDGGVADPMGFAPTAFPQTTGCSAGLSYGSKKWLAEPKLEERRLVGSAGNAPVVASGLFGDTRVTAGQPGHFPVKGMEKAE